MAANKSTFLLFVVFAYFCFGCGRGVENKLKVIGHCAFLSADSEFVAASRLKVLFHAQFPTGRFTVIGNDLLEGYKIEVALYSDANKAYSYAIRPAIIYDEKMIARSRYMTIERADFDRQDQLERWQNEPFIKSIIAGGQASLAAICRSNDSIVLVDLRGGNSAKKDGD